MRQLLLTGGTGFIGRHTIPALVARGFDVHLAVPPAEEPDSSAIAPAHVHHCDLFDPDAVARLVSDVRPSHLLHLAWYVEHGKFWNSPQNVSWVEASLRLVCRFRESGGVRAVVAGTCAEYGPSDLPCRENHTPLEPRSLYSVCKDGLRRVAEAYAVQTDLSLAWGRIFLLYGPGENPRRLVPSLILPLLNGQTATCNYGAHLRDFLHVTDVGQAFAALLDSDVRGAVNIAYGRPVSLGNLARLIAQLTGNPVQLQIQSLPATSDNPSAITADAARLNYEVGYQPQYDLATGLEQTLAWWRRRDMSFLQP